MYMQESVNNSLVNLLSYPYVEREVKKKKLSLLGGYYDFVTGHFTIWEKDSPHITIPPFNPLPPPHHH